MLGSVLKFFQGELSGYLSQIGVSNSKISFPSYKENRESIDFSGDGLNMMIVNIEEENSVRKADLFKQSNDGRSFPALPEIRLNLYLLFVADLAKYETSIDLLSLVIRYFQARRLFTKENSPRLALDYPDIERLTVELITLPFAQQNEVWNALRTSYKPSVLYKIRMIVFTQDDPLIDLQGINTIERQMNNK